MSCSCPKTTDSKAKDGTVDNKFYRSDNISFDSGANFSFDAWNVFWNVLKDAFLGGRAAVIPTFPILLPITAWFVVRVRGSLWLGDTPDYEIDLSRSPCVS